MNGHSHQCKLKNPSTNVFINLLFSHVSTHFIKCRKICRDKTSRRYKSNLEHWKYSKTVSNKQASGTIKVNFASCPCFASCIKKKHYFLLRRKETAFFPYFHYEIIFCSAELFECALKYFLHQNIFMFLNITPNKTSKK